jgi:rhodanese-related sulfurtransferase
MIPNDVASHGSVHRLNTPSPACGVYSVLAALNALGIQADTQAALDIRYIGTKSGSTAHELVLLAAKHGAHAKVWSGLTREHLMLIDRPVVLHFRSDGFTGYPDHWVLYLGCENGLPIIFDPPDGLGKTTWAQVLSQWNGVGIVLSTDEIPMSRFASASLLRYSHVTSLILFAWLLLNALKKFCTSFCKGIGHGETFLVYSALLVFISVAIQYFQPDGIASDSDAVQVIRSRTQPINAPSVTLEELISIGLNEPNVCIIDARYQKDFLAGSIPNAVNLPVDSTFQERVRVLRNIPKSKRIILYCQSSTCGFSDQIARFLVGNAYRDVSIFRGGYIEWINHRSVSNLSEMEQ